MRRCGRAGPSAPDAGGRCRWMKCPCGKIARKRRAIDEQDSVSLSRQEHGGRRARAACADDNHVVHGSPHVMGGCARSRIGAGPGPERPSAVRVRCTSVSGRVSRRTLSTHQPKSLPNFCRTSMLDRQRHVRRVSPAGRSPRGHRPAPASAAATASWACFAVRLVGSSAPFSVFYVYGLGGVGKSALLDRCAQRGGTGGRADGASRRADTSHPSPQGVSSCPGRGARASVTRTPPLDRLRTGRRGRADARFLRCA